MQIRKLPTIPTLPKKKRVAAYARVSSGKDAMLHSLSAQISYYSAYILTLNIETFHNYRSEDINELADELSVILASKMNRKAAAF
jgi:hypothetical protein